MDVVGAVKKESGYMMEVSQYAINHICVDSSTILFHWLVQGKQLRILS